MTSRERFLRPYPMVRALEAVPPRDWTGPVHVWDIDKTYLDTRFSQLKDLLKIPFEFGVDKSPVRGAVELLRGLRGGPDGRGHVPLHFVSASPPQIADAIERRMLLDGVEWDGITYKDPLRLLLMRQTDQLREQIAFKLSAMLMLAAQCPPGARFHLFGDDVEHDALVSCLFADILAGRLRGHALGERLEKAGCRASYIENIVASAALLAPREAVDGIWIRLERDPSGQWLEAHLPVVRGYGSAAALADVLEQNALISEAAARDVRQTGGAGGLVQGRAGARSLWTPPA